MPVAAGLDAHAHDIGDAADWQRPRRDLSRHSAGHHLCGVDRRVADFRQQRQSAGVILVAVADDQGIDRPHVVDLREEARLRPIAEVEQEPPAAALDEETGRAFAAEAGDGADGDRGS